MSIEPGYTARDYFIPLSVAMACCTYQGINTNNASTLREAINAFDHYMAYPEYAHLVDEIKMMAARARSELSRRMGYCVQSVEG